MTDAGGAASLDDTNIALLQWASCAALAVQVRAPSKSWLETSDMKFYFEVYLAVSSLVQRWPGFKRQVRCAARSRAPRVKDCAVGAYLSTQRPYAM